MMPLLAAWCNCTAGGMPVGCESVERLGGSGPDAIGWAPLAALPPFLPSAKLWTEPADALPAHPPSCQSDFGRSVGLSLEIKDRSPASSSAGIEHELSESSLRPPKPERLP